MGHGFSCPWTCKAAVLTALATLCVAGALGMYVAVGLLRFVWMRPPVTLRQAMQGRDGSCCCARLPCVDCRQTFDLSPQTPEQVQADRTLVKVLVAVSLGALVLLQFLDYMVCSDQERIAIIKDRDHVDFTRLRCCGAPSQCLQRPVSSCSWAAVAVIYATRSLWAAHRWMARWMPYQ
eukprot:SAG22_NODE_926_length_6466_cov_55.877179_5_plen_178_part_00